MLDRFYDFRDLFAFRQSNTIVTKKGEGPRAWTERRGRLDPKHVADHLMADLIPHRPPIWVGTRSFHLSKYVLIDVDFDTDSLLTLDELATIGKRRREAIKAKPSFKARLESVLTAFRRMGIDPEDPRQVLSQRTPRGGRHLYLFFDEAHPLDDLYDLLEAAGLEHKSGEIEFYPSTRHAIRLPFGLVPGQPHDPNAWMQWIDDYTNGRIYRFSIATLRDNLALHHDTQDRRWTAIREKRQQPTRTPPQPKPTTKQPRLGVPKSRSTNSSPKHNDRVQSFTDAQALLERGITETGTRIRILKQLAAHLIWFRGYSAEEATAYLTTWAMNPRQASTDIQADLAHGTHVVANQIKAMCRWYEARNRNKYTPTRRPAEHARFAPSEIDFLRSSTVTLTGKQRHEQADFLLNFLAFAKANGAPTPAHDGHEVAVAIRPVIRRWPGCSHKKYKARIIHATETGVLTKTKNHWQNPNGPGRASTYRISVPTATTEVESLDYETAIALLTGHNEVGDPVRKEDPRPSQTGDAAHASHTRCPAKSVETDPPDQLETRPDTDLGTTPRQRDPLRNAAQRVPHRSLRQRRTNRRKKCCRRDRQRAIVRRSIRSVQRSLMTTKFTRKTSRHIRRTNEAIMIRLPYTARRGNQPGYKGVRKTRDKFTAQVHQAGTRYHLGTFPTEHHAALAVNEALYLLFDDLPSRFTNEIPSAELPTPEEQAGIQLEVRLRLGRTDLTRNSSLANA
jgi:hypothetical protein